MTPPWLAMNSLSGPNKLERNALNLFICFNLASSIFIPFNAFSNSSMYGDLVAMSSKSIS